MKKRTTTATATTKASMNNEINDIIIIVTKDNFEDFKKKELVSSVVLLIEEKRREEKRREEKRREEKRREEKRREEKRKRRGVCCWDNSLFGVSWNLSFKRLFIVPGKSRKITIPHELYCGAAESILSPLCRLSQTYVLCRIVFSKVFHGIPAKAH